MHSTTLEQALGSAPLVIQSNFQQIMAVADDMHTIWHSLQELLTHHAADEWCCCHIHAALSCHQQRHALLHDCSVPQFVFHL